MRTRDSINIICMSSEFDLLILLRCYTGHTQLSNSYYGFCQPHIHTNIFQAIPESDTVSYGFVNAESNIKVSQKLLSLGNHFFFSLKLFPSHKYRAFGADDDNKNDEDVLFETWALFHCTIETFAKKPKKNQTNRFNRWKNMSKFTKKITTNNSSSSHVIVKIHHLSFNTHWRYLLFYIWVQTDNLVLNTHKMAAMEVPFVEYFIDFHVNLPLFSIFSAEFLLN